MSESYESLCERAQQISQTAGSGWYVAVVEIITYRTGRSTMTIVQSKGKPVASQQRGERFVGVLAQWTAGVGIYRKPKKVAVVDPELAPGQLPF